MSVGYKLAKGVTATAFLLCRGRAAAGFQSRMTRLPNLMRPYRGASISSTTWHESASCATAIGSL